MNTDSYVLTTKTLWKREKFFVDMWLLFHAFVIIFSYFLGGFDLFLFCLPSWVICYISLYSEVRRGKPSSVSDLIAIDDNGIIFYLYGAGKEQKRFLSWSDIDSIHSKYSIFHEEICVITVVLKNGYIIHYDLYRNTIHRICPIVVLKKKMKEYSHGKVTIEKVQFNFRMDFSGLGTLFNLNLKL